VSEELKRRNALIISYLSLRKAIGFLGILLPFVLYFGALIIFGTGLQTSISGYYHTGMRDVYVGTLCVIGFFLFSYKGGEKLGRRVRHDSYWIGWPSSPASGSGCRSLGRATSCRRSRCSAAQARRRGSRHVGVRRGFP